MTEHTILLTGITGFIAKRIAFDLLEKGYGVVGSLRSLDRAEEVRAALAPRLSDPAALDRLRFVPLDLMSDDGWDAAMDAVDAVMHTASPFPPGLPKDPEAVIRPAVDGVLRALSAAQRAGVTRVILTSSTVAIMMRELPQGHTLTEADWSDPAHPTAGPYEQSKTLAERAAWDFAAKHPEMQVTAINPGLVLGAPMDRHYGTSLGLIDRILSGKDPAMPDLGFPAVDVADVSALHIAALERPESIGQRYLCASGWATFQDMAQEAARLCPDRKIATRRAPKLLMRLLALWDPAVRMILPSLGRHLQVAPTAAETLLGAPLTPWRTALARSVAFVTAKPG